MNDFRSIIIAVTGAFFALLSPIQDFMAGMLILFAVNFVFGLLAAIFNGEKWSWRKAGMCFIYCLIFFATAASMFIVGHFMHTEEQALVCVKYVCFAAIYVFGTNILRNWRNLCTPGSPWYNLVSLLYYVLTVKFVERFKIFKHLSPEPNNDETK